VWPTDAMDAEQTAVIRSVLSAANELEVPYVLGGGHAVNRHGGPWRNTKDLDLFVPPDARDRVIDCLAGLGFTDYYSVWPYDREWIYRAQKGNKIVDVIWQSANKTGFVDAGWRERATPGEFAGVSTWFASAEDLIWLKAFIVQRDRCDWPDVLNLITAAEGRLNWDWLLERFGPHWRLLQAVFHLFDWTCPQHAGYVPVRIREELAWRVAGRRPSEAAGGRRPSTGANRTAPPGNCRWRLLDSRPWFVGCDHDQDGDGEEREEAAVSAAADG
jgi:hypothetical protein